MLETMSNSQPCEFLRKETKTMNNTRTKTFIAAMTLAAVGATGYAGFLSHTLHTYFALSVLALAAATSRMKVKLPGINGNMSMNLPFLLTAVVGLSAAEAVVIACVATLVQSWPGRDAKFNLQRTVFNLSMMAFASSTASLMFHAGWMHELQTNSITLGLALATATFFLGQTAPVAGIIAVSEGKSAAHIWWNIAQLSFPYFVVSAGINSMIQAASAHVGWELALAVFPAMFGIHRSYRLYFGHMVEKARPEMLTRAMSAGV
jgi:hypothetical protein